MDRPLALQGTRTCKPHTWTPKVRRIIALYKVWAIIFPKVCRTIALYKVWAIILPTFEGSGTTLERPKGPRYSYGGHLPNGIILILMTGSLRSTMYIYIDRLRTLWAVELKDLPGMLYSIHIQGL